MPEEEISFRELVERLRRGDQAAAAELVRRYEPALRRVSCARFGVVDRVESRAAHLRGRRAES
jgi:hypothetical protein